MKKRHQHPVRFPDIRKGVKGSAQPSWRKNEADRV